MSVHRLLGDLNDLGLRLVDSIETCLQLDFNWLVALISAIACLVMVYIMGLLYRGSWRLTAAVAASSMALNAATPLITQQPPWLSTLAVVTANLIVSVAIAVRLHRHNDERH